MYLGLFGSYSKNETVDVEYTLGGETEARRRRRDHRVVTSASSATWSSSPSTRFSTVPGALALADLEAAGEARERKVDDDEDQADHEEDLEQRDRTPAEEARPR